MFRHFRTGLAACCVGALSATLLVSYAGPLDPPAGPVTSSYKTLNEVEPRIPLSAATTPGDADSVFRITQSGSYYLTGNLNSQAGKHGIEIAINAVTIDLRGFALAGGAGSLDAVQISVLPANSMTVRNGSVRGWEGAGINLPARNSMIEDVRVIACVGNNIAIGGRSIVRNCVSTESGGYGIQAVGATEIRSCTAQNNALGGIFVGGTCIIRDCVAGGNTGNGITVNYGSALYDCQASLNGGDGINAVFNGATISGCSLASNGGDGIEVSADSYLLNNKCDGNLNGIHVTGIDNRIEANGLTDSFATGLLVDAGENLIIRNSATGNVTQFSIAAGNAVGPIVTAATIAVSSNPHANYEY